MSRFPQEQNPSDPSLANVYREFCDVTGSPRPDNFFTAMSLRPDLAVATWDLAKVLFSQGQLPPHVTQLMIVAISHQAGCRYCADSHERALSSMGFDKEAVEHCLNNLADAAIPDIHKGIIAFAVKAADDPNSISDHDVESLRNLGASDEEIVEIAVVIAMTKLINTWADATAIAVESLN